MTEWRPVVGWEDAYEVSADGRVRSIDRFVPHNRVLKQRIAGRELFPTLNSNGYLGVGLRRGRSFRKYMRVHRMVADAFIPNPLGKPNVNHIDCDPANNRADNLEWCTQAENLAHMTNLGRRSMHMIGRRSPNAKLSEEDVRQIRADYSAGHVSYETLATKFASSKRAIGRLIKRETYSDVC